MKLIFTLLLSTLFSFSLFAYDGSRLSISTVSNAMDLKIEVDGRKFLMEDNSITLSNLSEGTHHIRIYRDKMQKNRRNGNVYDEGNGNSFGQARRQEIIYAGTVFLRQGFHTDITVSRFGKVFTDERRMERFENDQSGYDEDEYGDWDHPSSLVMTTRDFDLVKEQIRREWFENTRLISVKTIIDKNNFTTQQVKELMLLFTFENNRLDVAKYAYRQTVDKQNYYLLNDAFNHSSSREALARFIRDAR